LGDPRFRIKIYALQRLMLCKYLCWAKIDALQRLMLCKYLCWARLALPLLKMNGQKPHKIAAMPNYIHEILKINNVITVTVTITITVGARRALPCNEC
jgi:hypothetical protein